MEGTFPQKLIYSNWQAHSMNFEATGEGSEPGGKDDNPFSGENKWANKPRLDELIRIGIEESSDALLEMNSSRTASMPCSVGGIIITLIALTEPPKATQWP